MNKILAALGAAAFLAACGSETAPTEAPAPVEPLKSGVELTGMDTSVRPQDDYYAYANGNWLKETEIPADQFGWGSYMTLRDDSLTDVKAIVDEVAGDAADSEAAAKIGNYYNAYMNEERIEELGMSPLEGIFTDIDAIEDHKAMSRWFGENNDIGIDGPFNLYINQDDKDSTTYAMFIVQSGLGLPDKEYYFDDSERGLQLRDWPRTTGTRKTTAMQTRFTTRPWTQTWASCCRTSTSTVTSPASDRAVRITSSSASRRTSKRPMKSWSTPTWRHGKSTRV
jgi:predicted metalloendopeptidase